MIEQQQVSMNSNSSRRILQFGAFWDVLVIILVLVSVKQSLLPYSYLLAGPASTLSAMIVATILLRRRKIYWADLGFKWPDNWPKTAILTVVVFVVIAVSGAVMGWFSGLFFEDLGSSGRFDYIEGNFLAYLGILVLVWTHGSIFEELIFRAFIISRTNTFLGGSFRAGIAAAIFASIFFGYRHYYYQGMKGAITTGAIGLSLSLLYLWFGKRNIIPLILGHGLINTISQTQRFLGPSVD